MYRIELSPGEETAFRTIEELAVAIRRKVVTSRARIYHNATGKWLPIQFHPHYQVALAMPLTQADLVAGPPVAPLSVLKLGDPLGQTAPPAPSNRESATQAALAAWPEPKPSSAQAPQSRAAESPKIILQRQEPIRTGTTAPAPRAVAPQHTMEPRRVAGQRQVIEPQRAAMPSRMPVPQRIPVPPRLIELLASAHRDTGSRRRRKPQRSLRVALAGAVLLACANLVLSGASGRSSEVSARARTPRQLITAPTEILRDVTPRTIAAVMPMLQSIPVLGLGASGSPAASPTKTSAAVSISTPQPVTNSPVRAAADSAPVVVPEPDIEAAPDAAPLTLGVPLQPESLAPQVVDSSGKKSMKRILRTIGGSAPSETRPLKR